MDGIRIETNAAKLIRKINRLPKAMQAGLRDGAVRGLLTLEDRVRRHTSVKWRHGAAGLAGRLTSFATLSGELGLDAAIGFRKTRGFPYELAQEFGAKAKPGKAMAIPITEKARRAGSPRNMDDLVLIKGPKRAVLAENIVSARVKGQLTVHYVLMKSIPARLRFRENVTAGIPQLSREMVKGAKLGMARA